MDAGSKKRQRFELNSFLTFTPARHTSGTEQEIIQDMKDDLDSRRIGSQSHYDKEKIIHMMDALHDALLKKIACVGQSGYAAVYASQSDAYGKDADVVLQRVSENNDVTCTTNTITMIEPDGGQRFQFFYRKGGAVPCLPERFVFPRMRFATLLTSWFCGNQRKKQFHSSF